MELLGEVLAKEIMQNDERLFIPMRKEVQEEEVDEIPTEIFASYVAKIVATVDNSKLLLTRKPKGTKAHFDYGEGDDEHKAYLRSVTKVYNTPNKFATHYTEESTWESSLGLHRQSKIIIVDKQTINLKGKEDEIWKREKLFLTKKKRAFIDVSDMTTKQYVLTPRPVPEAKQLLTKAAAIDSALMLQQIVKEDEDGWRPMVMVWTWTVTEGLKCKVFGREKIDGCKTRGFRTFLQNHTEHEARNAFAAYSKTLDHRLACEKNVWNLHYHLGYAATLSNFGITVPYLQMSDDTMTQITYDAKQQFTDWIQAGNEPTKAESQDLERADQLHQEALLFSASVKRTKKNINNEAREYLAKTSSKNDISFVHAFKNTTVMAL